LASPPMQLTMSERGGPWTGVTLFWRVLDRIGSMTRWVLLEVLSSVVLFLVGNHCRREASGTVYSGQWNGSITSAPRIRSLNVSVWSSGMLDALQSR
jgi:hypothetical protein